MNRASLFGLLTTLAALTGCQKDKKIIAEYRQMQYWSATAFPAAPATAGDLYSKQYGPILLQDPLVVQPKLRTLYQKETGARAILDNAESLALYAAGLRLQGKNPDDDPASLDLFLGTLLCELQPPKWWTSADWLRERLGARPDGPLRMGLLTRAVVDARLQTLLAHPEELIPPLPDADGSALVSPRYLQAMMDLGAREPSLIRPEQNPPLVALWKFATRPDFRESVEAVYRQQPEMLALLRPHAGADGSVKARLIMPAHWKTWGRIDATAPGEDLTPAVRDTVRSFLRLNGLQLVEDEAGTPVSVDLVARRYQGLPYIIDTSTTTHTDRIELVPDPVRLTAREASGFRTDRAGVFERRWAQLFDPHPFKARKVEDVHYQRAHKEEVGDCWVPALVLTIGGRAFEAPPYARPNKPSAEGASYVLQNHPTYPANSVEAVAVRFALEDALLPWRYGRPTNK